MKIAAVKKIAVVRANALGDYIFSLPALESLRAAYPTAEIVLLAQPWHAGFLQGRPGPLDRVIAIPRCPGVSAQPDAQPDREGLAVFFEAMAAEHFDLAIQLHGGGRYSNPFVQRLRARITVGLKAGDAPPLDRSVAYVYYQPEILRYLEVVAMAGAPPVTLEPHLAVTPADRAAAAPFLPPDGTPLAVLHPGATDPRRRWSAPRFAALGDRLAAAGAAVVVTGVESERPLVEAVVAGMTAPARNLCGRLSLGGLTGLLAAARLVVANDTGPLHLAVAVATATVGIYWCGNLIIADPMTRNRHRTAVSWQLTCPECGTNTMERRCEHNGSFVDAVSVEEVCAQALELLAAPPNPLPPAPAA